MSRRLLGLRFAPSDEGGPGAGALRDEDGADIIIADYEQPLAVDDLGTYVHLGSVTNLDTLQWDDTIMLHDGDQLQMATLSDLKRLLSPGRERVVPDTTVFTTWGNQGAATVTDVDKYGIDLRRVLADTNFNIVSLTRDVPASSPWSCGIGMSRLYHGYSVSALGLGVIGTNGKLCLMLTGYDSGAYSIMRAANHTTYTNRPTTRNSGFAGQGYMRVDYDGTNLRWFVSSDGIRWTKVYKHTVLHAFDTVTPADAVPLRWGPVLHLQKYNSFVQDLDVGIGVWDWFEE